jgi:hypothetical protein
MIGGDLALGKAVSRGLTQLGYYPKLLNRHHTPSELTASLVGGIDACVWDLTTIVTSQLPSIERTISLISGAISPPTTRNLFDFRFFDPEWRYLWGALDDVVMGGVSGSNFMMEHDRAVFSGNVSTNNSGGFVSARTQNFSPLLNLSGYSGIQLQITGDGQRYKLFLRTDESWDGLGYAVSFLTKDNEPSTVEVSFDKFIPVFRARTVSNVASLDASKICAMQLMLSKFEYDGVLNPQFSPGLFNLEIAAIRAYGGKKYPQMVVAIESKPKLIDAVAKMLDRSSLFYTIVSVLPDDLTLTRDRCLAFFD